MNPLLAQLLSKGRFRLSVGILLLVVAFAVLGPMLDTRNPLFAVGGRYDPPSANAILGTDVIGNDVFLQLMHGLGTSLKIGLIAGLVATAIGVLIGTLAGFLGGVVDEILMGLTNVVITIPTIVILILLSVALESRTLVSLALIIGVTSWPWTARAIRAQTASLRVREHVDVARLSGAGTFSIILWEILPYMFSYIFMAFVLQLASAILSEAALSLLGLGPDNTISLGKMLQFAIQGEAIRTGAYWAFLPPTLLLTVISFALLLLQSSLDEVFNPRLRRA
ncbi:Dipeptide transport system permease protein DppC [Meiothermus luteus]|jgi:peptide/nickel transport system permease protein|uniref:Dipeptide transport system permease protein DppC n=1 Tax=Meiothermus luteus TaxID=2026184 RepID=A0A399EZL3_9DEIN|nr:ABC transporter permease [Meiothermus luteus]RIH88479.1 Dipeptide transport system permease protein DppC [Meiothermus luteus]RMH57322.1 MAG: ABC transporter permease subunit [Deinococcota bacterium]